MHKPAAMTCLSALLFKTSTKKNIKKFQKMRRKNSTQYLPPNQSFPNFIPLCPMHLARWGFRGSLGSRSCCAACWPACPLGSGRVVRGVVPPHARVPSVGPPGSGEGRWAGSFARRSAGPRPRGAPAADVFGHE